MDCEDIMLSEVDLTENNKYTEKVIPESDEYCQEKQTGQCGDSIREGRE